MNVQKLFHAIRDVPDQHSLLVAVGELERQGYTVTVGRKYRGFQALAVVVENNEVDSLELGLGVVVELERGEEKEAFRLQFLDLDAVGITDVESPPIVYDPRFTIGEFG